MFTSYHLKVVLPVYQDLINKKQLQAICTWLNEISVKMII